MRSVSGIFPRRIPQVLAYEQSEPSSDPLGGNCRVVLLTHHINQLQAIFGTAVRIVCFQSAVGTLLVSTADKNDHV